MTKDYKDLADRQYTGLIEKITHGAGRLKGKQIFIVIQDDPVIIVGYPLNEFTSRVNDEPSVGDQIVFTVRDGEITEIGFAGGMAI